MGISTEFRHLAMGTSDAPRACAFFEKALGWTVNSYPENVKVGTARLQMGPDQEIHLLEVDGFEVSCHASQLSVRPRPSSPPCPNALHPNPTDPNPTHPDTTHSDTTHPDTIDPSADRPSGESFKLALPRVLAEPA